MPTSPLSVSGYTDNVVRVVPAVEGEGHAGDQGEPGGAVRSGRSRKPAFLYIRWLSTDP